MAAPEAAARSQRPDWEQPVGRMPASWPAPRPGPIDSAEPPSGARPLPIDSETILKWGGVGLVVLAVLCLSLAHVMARAGVEGPSQVAIAVSGQSLGSFDLHQPRQVRAAGARGETEIEIEAGRARIRSSRCPHEVCVRRGWISRPGQVSICVPNRVVLEIVGQKSASQVDGISR